MCLKITLRLKSQNDAIKIITSVAMEMLVEMLNDQTVISFYYT